MTDGHAALIQAMIRAGQDATTARIAAAPSTLTVEADWSLFDESPTPATDTHAQNAP